MNHEKYRQLYALLQDLEQDERLRVNSQNRGPGYLAMVDQELFHPIARLQGVLSVRINQTANGTEAK